MDRNKKIKDVKRVLTGVGQIENESTHFDVIGTEGCLPKNRDEIEWLADEPCVEACKKLYDLNIRTVSSNGNLQDLTEFEGWVGIDYFSLSDENMRIANDLMEKGLMEGFNDFLFGFNGYGMIRIVFPICGDDLVGDLSDKFLSVANNFKKQDVLYCRTTIQELMDKWFSNVKYGNSSYPNDVEKNSDELKEEFVRNLKEGNFGYTDDGEVFFETEELLRKHREYVKEKSSTKKR